MVPPREDTDPGPGGPDRLPGVCVDSKYSRRRRFPFDNPPGGMSDSARFHDSISPNAPAGRPRDPRCLEGFFRMSDQEFKSFVPADSQMREFTGRALVLGLLMSVVLGAANAYLGLKAGMTIAATYPAAVIGMAVLRIFKGSLLEENFARTVGSIGESVAAGAIFTIPAFVILQLWQFNTRADYVRTSALMIVGGVLGVLFVTVLRRVMVEDKDLPYPEAVAAS